MKPEEFKALRKSHGLEVVDLANRLHVSPAAVRQWEYGHRRPRPETLRKILRLYAKLDGCTCSCHGAATSKYRRSWSEEENRILRTVIEEGGTPQDVRDRLPRERTLKSIGKHAWAMGLSFADSPKKLSTTQAARLLGVSQAHVGRLVLRGEIPAERHISQDHGVPMRWWRIRVEDLEAYRRRSGSHV